MTNTKQELIAIRDGAPSDPAIAPTHVDSEGFYWVLDGFTHYAYNKYKNGFYTPTWDVGLEQFRSLSDISHQIEMLEQNEALEARVAGLESKLTDIHATKLDMGSYWSVAYPLLEDEVI